MSPFLKTHLFNLKTTLVALLLQSSLILSWGADPTLIWSDEFDTDGQPDPAKWKFDVGGDGWGNNESQYYTDNRPENARVESGVLIIEARKEQWLANPIFGIYNDYTSARLISKGSGDWLYGRIEVRAKLPAGNGTWPAIWMLPTGQAYGGWPNSGEIDIMEHVGFDMGTVHGSLHTIAHNWNTGTQPTGSTIVPDADTAFHTYSIDWSPTKVDFLLDGAVYYSATNPQTGWEEWPFDQPFHLIMNLAVGGFWGGQQGIDPDIWPQRLEVDYVRVYDLGDTIPLDTDEDQDPNETDPDDDDDGLTDDEEHALGTNLLVQDTDGDGFSDFDESEAGSNPLSSASIPGEDSGLLENPDFSLGESPWIIHTNKWDSTWTTWKGAAATWGGNYDVSDYISSLGDGLLLFDNYKETGTPNAEHLLYQEWKISALGVAPGDIVRFKGTASAVVSSDEFITEAFIRILDFSFQPLPATALATIDSETRNFELQTIIEQGSINVFQVGILIKGPTTETASVTFSNLEATLNTPFMWALWPVELGVVDTGAWMGTLHVDLEPWIWNETLGSWIYLNESDVDESGSWVYFPKAN
jgi:beta-glucanase (GH16 family)